MYFKLHICTDNAAFDDGNKQYEIARILRGVAGKVESEGVSAYYQNMRDINGNIVGCYAEKPELKD